MKKSLSQLDNPEVPGNEEIFSWIKNIVSFGYRRPGTEADHLTIRYIEEKFKEFGLQDVHQQSVDIPLWQANQWSLTVNGDDIPCFYIPHTYWIKEDHGFVAGKEGIEAEMVYIGEGTLQDFRKFDVQGKIVVAEVRFNVLEWDTLAAVSYFKHDPGQTIPPGFTLYDPYSPNNFPDVFYQAVKHGALGFVGILTDYYDRNTFYNEIYGEDLFQMPIPGLWLSRSEGEIVKAKLASENTTSGKIVLDGTIEPAKGGNVVGILPGISDDTILISSHHDSPWQNAVQDASGVSSVLALAKIFGQKNKKERNKTLMFVTTDTHFSLYQAHQAFIESLKETGRNIIIDISLEHIGKEVVEKNGELIATDEVYPRGIFVSENKRVLSIVQKAVENNNLERMLLLPTYTSIGVPTDAFEYHKVGIPIISLISPPPYLFDIADTPDKVAVDQLCPIAEAFSDIINEIDALPSHQITKREFMIKHRFRYYRQVLKSVFGWMFRI